MTQEIKTLLEKGNGETVVANIKAKAHHQSHFALRRMLEMEQDSETGQNRKEVVDTINELLAATPPRIVSDTMDCCGSKVQFVENDPPRRCPVCGTTFASPDQMQFSVSKDATVVTPESAFVGTTAKGAK